MKKVAILFIVLLTSSFVFAQKTYVPDDKFEQALIDLGYDTTLDDSVLTANISGVTNLDVSDKAIRDLTGIEGFAALTELYCSGNGLTSLDVSKNTALVGIYCNNNQLASLDVSKNTALETLGCGANQLTSLDVSNNTALTELLCYNNQLTSLDLTANTALTYLRVDDNQLTSLDVSANTALDKLWCSDNKFTSLDVSKNTALTVLDIGSVYLTNLDVSNNTALTYLGIKYSITSLDVTNNTALTALNVNHTKLTSLDVSKNTALEGLDCSFNKLTSLDVSKNTALVALNCSWNQLTSLDVSKNTALVGLNCSWNQLTSLDVSKNTALRSLYCSGNKLTSLNMKNGLKIGAGVNDIYLNANTNSLTCIETLDPVYADTNRVVGVFGTSTTDGGVTFSLSCMEDFEWMSSASDTINITESNLADTYTLQWESSNDESSVNYRVYAKIGVYPAEQMYDTTVTALSITYQEILEKVFEGSPTNGATVKFQVIAKNGAYSKDVTGDDRVLYVNRYDYLSVENQSIPTEFALHENYPNPFNPSTTLRFDLPEASNITLTIYNMLGQKVRTFDYQNTSAGYHSVKWNATNDYGDPVGAGVYLYQLQTKDFVKTRKMVLLK